MLWFGEIEKWAQSGAGEVRKANPRNHGLVSAVAGWAKQG